MFDVGQHVRYRGAMNGQTKEFAIEDAIILEKLPGKAYKISVDGKTIECNEIQLLQK